MDVRNEHLKDLPVVVSLGLTVEQPLWSNSRRADYRFPERFRTWKGRADCIELSDCGLNRTVSAREEGSFCR